MMSGMPLHNGITFIVTRRCPLQCDHCVMESGPWYRDYLTGRQMKTWISEARSLGITRVSYSGGDPVLYLRDLGEAIAYAHDRGMVNSLFTSGFWAPTVEKGASTLKRLSGVDVLGLSTSTFHEQFVPLDRIVNAVIAAREVGISGVAVQVADFAEPAAEIQRRLREMLPADAQRIPIERQSIFRAGRSVAALSIPEEEYAPVDELDTSCPAPALTIEPDGLLRGCCSSLLALKDANPLILGDLGNEPLRSVLDRAARQRHYHVIRTEGLGPVIQALREDGLSAAIPDKAVNACDLCYQLYRQPEVTAHLKQRFSGEVASEGEAP